MPLTEKENELRLRARALIERGVLPDNFPAQTWGGYGAGKPCSLCGQAIQQDDVEYEVEDRSGETPSLYQFHFMCHAAWQFECARQDHLNRMTGNSPSAKRGKA